MEYTTEQLEEIFKLSKIWTNIFLGVLLALIILAIVDSYLTTRAKKKYYKELNQEEQHCINKYNNITWFKNKKK